MAPRAAGKNWYTGRRGAALLLRQQARSHWLPHSVAGVHVVAVIGAGPIGLSVAYHLQQRHIPYRVFEQQTIGWAWSNFYDRLHLNTERTQTGLPGMPMPTDYPAYPSRDAFLAYLVAYARHFRLAINEHTAVQQVSFDRRDGWSLATTQGWYHASVLIAAMGVWSTPHRPPLLDEGCFGGPIIHAQGYRNPAPFLGQRVLVVGAGSSGCEIAVDLSERGVDTTIAIRDGLYLTPRTRPSWWIRTLVGLLRRLPAGLANAWLRRSFHSYAALGIPLSVAPPLSVTPVVDVGFVDAVRARRIAVVGPIERCLPGGVRFRGGRELAFDAIILATGYRPTVGPVRAYLDCSADGCPVLDGWRSTRNRWLYCPGFWYPDAAHWFSNFQQVGRTVVEQVQREHRRELQLPAPAPI